MFSTLLKLAFLAAPVLADFAISKPDFVQCQDVQISWGKTTGPYNLIVVKSTDPCGDAVADLGDHDGTQITWKAALPAGYKVQLSLEDANGDEAWSGDIIVGASNDTSCLPANLKAAAVASQGQTNSGSNSSSNSTSSGSTNPDAAAANTPVVTVTPTLTVDVGASSSSSVAGPSAVGAANAGFNPLDNGAPSLRQASTPIMVLGALAAVVVAAL